MIHERSQNRGSICSGMSTVVTFVTWAVIAASSHLTHAFSVTHLCGNGANSLNMMNFIKKFTDNIATR